MSHHQTILVFYSFFSQWNNCLSQHFMNGHHEFMLTGWKCATGAPCFPLNYPWCCINTSSGLLMLPIFPRSPQRLQCSLCTFGLILFKLYNYFNFSNFTNWRDPIPSVTNLCNLSIKMGNSQEISYGNMLLERLTD